MKCKQFFFILVLIVTTQLFSLKARGGNGDSVLNGLAIETKVQYGSVVPHHTSVAYLLQENIVGFDLAFITQSKNRHFWEEAYRNPSYGLGYSFLKLGNDDVLGNMHAFYGLINIPFNLPTNKHYFFYEGNVGLGYFKDVYAKYDNPLNLLMSSHYNVYLGLDLGWRYKISQKSEIKTALELTHCSNGKTRTPNLGVNIVTLSASWLYSIKPAKPSKPVFKNIQYKRHFVEFLWNAGGKRDENMKDIVYFVSSGIVDYYYAYSPKYSFGLGADVFYDASLSGYYSFHENVPLDNSVNYQMGMHVGFRARYHRFFFLVNAGYYLKYEYLRHGKVYSRIGLRYALSETIIINLSLKAHNTIADFIECGIGYRLKTQGK